MNQTLYKILKSREDISDYLFHFTKKKDAKETLIKIVGSNVLKDVGNKGFLCFTEAPLPLLIDMFKIFEKHYDPMYAPYGIAVRKDYFFKLGGRTVIYGSNEDKNEIADTSKWRFEEYEPNVRDFSWLREWRINSSELTLNENDFFIITKTKEELSDIAFEIEDIEFDGCVADGGFWGFATATTHRKFKGLSIQDLEEFEKLSKSELEDILKTQNLDDTKGKALGSFIL